MKRFIPLALIVPLAVAGCSSSSKGNSSTNTTAASSATTSASSATTAGGSSGANMNTGNPASAQSINEAGSTLLYPFLQEIAPAFHSAYPNATLNPGPGGSGKGISDAIAGTAQLGGSDAYLSNSQRSSNPGLLNIPIAISSQAVNYNVPGVSNLKLTGDVLAQMYEGKITKWNDQAIASLNPGVTLPATTIVPVRRVDASGDTFIFTSFLSDTNSAWQSGPDFGTSVTWPAVSNELTANGNPGMVQTCHATPGCIAYIGISSEDAAQAAGLGEAMLQNKSGSYVLPSAATVEAAVSAGAGSIPANLAEPLIYESGSQSYPIVNFEYIVVKDKQSSADMAMAIRDFLAFAISPTGGSTPTFLAKEHFQGLPSSAVPPVQSAIASISS
ncbi:MAG: phosphate ABC transporter substrate-binding protein PstS [Actinomycetota bacterium]|nr:phosphate ABC transporter substrate-binding protein PstS [Actinomycetota bacterium]